MEGGRETSPPPSPPPPSPPPSLPPSSPFWLPTAGRSRRNHYQSSSSLLPCSFRYFAFAAVGILFIWLLFVYVPPFFSAVARFLRPNHVRKSWDTLNLFLVLFAVVCGFLSRSGRESASEHYFPASAAAVAIGGATQKSPPLAEVEIPDWFRLYTYNPYDYTTTEPQTHTPLKSSSSYPDLRPPPEAVMADNWRNFSDDSDLSSHHRRRIQNRHRDVVDRTHRASSSKAAISPAVTVRSIVKTAPPAPRAEERRSSAPESSPATTNRLRNCSSYPDLTQGDLLAGNTRRQFRDDSEVNSPKRSDHRRELRRRMSCGEEFLLRSNPNSFLVDKHVVRIFDEVNSRSEKSKSEPEPGKTMQQELDILESSSASSAPPPRRSIERTSTPVKKRTRGPAKDLATAISSLYHRKKLKNSKNKVSSSSEDMFHTSATRLRVSDPPPPPPPMAVFHHWFAQKKSPIKTSRATGAQSPSSPPTVRRSANNASPRNRPAKFRNAAGDLASDRYPMSGSQSPLVPVVPPPPPPFVVAEPSFEVEGDFVRIWSGGGDVSDSEAGDICEGAGDGRNEVAFWPSPSPSVDARAGSFIARFRAGLRLEKAGVRVGPS